MIPFHGEKKTKKNKCCYLCMGAQWQYTLPRIYITSNIIQLIPIKYEILLAHYYLDLFTKKRNCLNSQCIDVVNK